MLDPSANQVVNRVQRFLASAKLCLDHGDAESAVSRGYYALYHMTILLLRVSRSVNRDRWDHDELHRVFLDQFCKLGFKFSITDGEDWARIKDARIDSDYSRGVVNLRRAQISIERAERLIIKMVHEVGANA